MRYFYLILLSAFFCASCSGGKGFFSSRKKQVKTKYIALTDSLDTVWKEMFASDDKKLEDVKRLLDEVSYTDTYDVHKLDKIKQMRENVFKVRYKPLTMTSAEIDAYDNATDSLLYATYALVDANPEMKNHTITENLVNEIQAEDGKVIIFRVHYDHFAKEFNALLENNARRLEKMENPYNTYQKRPLFQLP